MWFLSHVMVLGCLCLVLNCCRYIWFWAFVQILFSFHMPEVLISVFIQFLGSCFDFFNLVHCRVYFLWNLLSVWFLFYLMVILVMSFGFLVSVSKVQCFPVCSSLCLCGLSFFSCIPLSGFTFSVSLLVSMFTMSPLSASLVNVSIHFCFGLL